jgi:UPF0755 protein
MKWILRLLLALIVLVALSAAGGWYAANRWLEQPLPMRGAPVEVSIEPGMSPAAVAQAWVGAGIDENPRLLYEWFRWSGQARSIRAGSYAVDKPTTPRELLAKMVRGDEVLESVRLTEGHTFRQIRHALVKASNLKPTTEALSDADLMKAIGAPGVAPEGRFFPDTYAYGRGVSDVAVLKRAYASMQRQLEKAWAARPANTPLKSIDEALILASIVEKETGLDADRGKVGAVFNNRLRIGMPLQTDPTVIYGLGDAFDGNLRKRDLTTDTPYNTYTRKGLPPTPIAMPGAPSIRAAINPDASKALYFVARGDGTGGSVFSETLDAHNRAVNQFQRKAGRSQP